MNDVNQELTPQTVDQFNLLQQKRFHANLVGDLTSWRKLKGQYEAKANTILGGYYTQMLMIDRMLVRNKANKQIVIQ